MHKTISPSKFLFKTDSYKSIYNRLLLRFPIDTLLIEILKSGSQKLNFGKSDDGKVKTWQKAAFKVKNEN